MRVLLIGRGGREHAIGWKLAQSPRVDEVMSLPGNPGLADLGPVVEGVDPTDVGAVAALARVHGVDLVLVGPEAPLAAGISDALSRLGIPTFGPTRAAARLESSKGFAKAVMSRAGVPTGAWARFTEPEPARRHIDSADGPYVVKADGLAGGKGVLVTESKRDAISWAEHWLHQGAVVVEEFLEGPEVSVFAVCTERGAAPLQPARDYKRLLDGDEGPNTGGMGSYSPVIDLPHGLVQRVMGEVVEPTLQQMDEDGSLFFGFLYAGLVLTDSGPKVLEFNVRLGDPEAQAVLPLMTTDLIDVLEGAQPQWSDQATVNVVLAAKGYPTEPETGAVINGLDSISDDTLVFHAGTRLGSRGLVASGGRVLNLVGMGGNVELAREAAYEAVELARWPGAQFRRDIGL